MRRAWTSAWWEAEAEGFAAPPGDGDVEFREAAGAGFESRRLAMAYKLIMAVQDRWRAVNAPHLVALVRAGATFVNGKLAERDEDQQSVTRPRVHRRRDIALVTGIQAVSQTLLT